VGKPAELFVQISVCLQSAFCMTVMTAMINDEEVYFRSEK
jgi:hypothetical protein